MICIPLRKNSMWRKIYLILCLWPSFVCAQTKAIEDSTTSLIYLIEAEKYFIIDEYDKAAYMLEQSLKAEATNSASHFKYAQLYALRESYTKALDHIRQAIDLRPDNKYYYLEAVQIALQAYLLQEAIFYYELLLDRIPSVYSYYLPLADLYLQEGQVDASLRAYKKFETKVGYSKALGLSRYNIYLEEGQISEAVAEAKRLCVHFPEEDSLHIIYAKCLAEEEKSSLSAITYLEEIVAADPTRSSLAFVLSNYYIKEAHSDRASYLLNHLFADTSVPLNKKLALLSSDLSSSQERWALLDTLCRQLLKKYPRHPKVRSTAAVLYQSMLYLQTSLRHSRVALRLGETSRTSFARLISLELDLQKYDSAEIHTREALSFYPRQPIFYLFLGAAQYFQKQQSAALNTLQQGLSICFDSTLKAQLHLQIAAVYEEIDKEEEAASSYEEALFLSPHLPEALQKYSYYLAVRKKKLDYALRLSTYLLNSQPNSPTYLDTKGWVLYAQGKYKSARDYLEKALQIVREPSGKLLEHYGDTLYHLGEIEAALEQWRKAQGRANTSTLLDAKIADKKLYE